MKRTGSRHPAAFEYRAEPHEPFQDGGLLLLDLRDAHVRPAVFWLDTAARRRSTYHSILMLDGGWKGGTFRLTERLVDLRFAEAACPPVLT